MPPHGRGRFSDRGLFMAWMQAVSLQKNGELIFGAYPGMEALPGEKLLTVRYAGVGLDDVAFVRNGPALTRLPRVPGRRFVACDDMGQFYAVWPLSTCGRCARCEEGRGNLCVRKRMLGVDYDGGWSEFVAVPEENMVPLPSGLDPILGVFAEPLARAINAVRLVAPQAGSVLLSTGDTVEAALAALAALHAGALPFLYATSRAAEDRFGQFAAHLGIETGAACTRRFFDCVVAASRDLLHLPNDLARILPGGRCVLFGPHVGLEAVPSTVLRDMQEREVTVIGACAATMEDMETAVRLLLTQRDAVRALIDRVEFFREMPALINGLCEGRLIAPVACPSADVF